MWKERSMGCLLVVGCVDEALVVEPGIVGREYIHDLGSCFVPYVVLGTLELGAAGCDVWSCFRKGSG